MRNHLNLAAAADRGNLATVWWPVFFVELVLGNGSAMGTGKKEPVTRTKKVGPTRRRLFLDFLLLSFFAKVGRARRLLRAHYSSANKVGRGPPVGRLRPIAASRKVRLSVRFHRKDHSRAQQAHRSGVSARAALRLFEPRLRYVLARQGADHRLEHCDKKAPASPDRRHNFLP